MNRSILCLAACLSLGVAAPASAQQLDLLGRVASSSTTMAPVFSQIIVFSTPKGYKGVNEVVKDNRYLAQSVPVDQSLERWTEMISVTGDKDAATLPGVTAELMANGMAGIYKESCPDSFSDGSFGAAKVGNNDAFVSVVSCGTTELAKKKSQAVMIVAVKGDRDMYTIQWAETGAPSATPIPVDARRWQDRLLRIVPIRLCAFKPGDTPPFESCAKR